MPPQGGTSSTGPKTSGFALPRCAGLAATLQLLVARCLSSAGMSCARVSSRSVLNSPKVNCQIQKTGDEGRLVRVRCGSLHGHFENRKRGIACEDL